MTGVGTWTPIGTKDKPFHGTFDGDGHEIQGIIINAPIADNQGLFGYTETEAKIKNLGVADVDILGRSSAGGIAGYNKGSISSSHSTGSVSANSTAGGIAGVNAGSIISSYSTGNVSATGSYGGGIAGYNYGTIRSSYSTGSVTANFSTAGGIAGENDSSGNIANCAALNVSVGGNSKVGKIVGSNNGTFSGNYAIATMKVTGSGEVDGEPLAYISATGFSKSWRELLSDTSCWENTG